jgi:hypothetical protein
LARFHFYSVKADETAMSASRFLTIWSLATFLGIAHGFPWSAWAQNQGRSRPLSTPVPRRAEPQTIDELIDRLQGEATFSGKLREVPNSPIERWPQRIYIDPDFDFATVTRDPGKTWRDCQTDTGQCVAWPDGRSQIDRVVGVRPMEQEVLSIATGEIETVQYVKIRYRYSREFSRQDGSRATMEQVGEGWIDSRVLRREHQAPIYREEPKPARETQRPAPAKNPDCPEDESRRNLRDIADLTRFMNKTPTEQLSATVEALHPHLGLCPLEPPNQKRTERWAKKQIYDVEALPLLTKARGKLPPVPKQSRPNGPLENASFEDVVAVDTLARTIYSEMNECFKLGLQYPMAAAKVALNRAKLANNNRAPAHFVGSRHAPEKPVLSQVLTAPYQFSVWNHIGAANPRDKTILMSLCPSRDESKKNWTGARPGPDDRAAWNFALKIASEAVLFPHRFEAKTKDVTQLYYTSKMESYAGRSRPDPAPRIEGRPVESLRCMYVWNGR